MGQSRILRAAAKLWYVKTLDLRSAVPVPRDSHEVFSGERDPDRVLLIGNGHTHGWGTLTHKLAFTGQLSRTLSRVTGRPTDVTYVGDEMMNLASVIPWLRGTRLDDFDQVLLVLSMNDALRLTPPQAYRTHMEALLTKLTCETKPSARIVVAGITDVAVLPLYRGIWGRLAQVAADRLNNVVRELVGRFDGVRFVDIVGPEAEAGRPDGSPGMYADWSSVFTASCVPALEEARALDPARVRVEASEQEWEWAPAEYIVNAAPAEGWAPLARIVEAAKQDFRTDIAYISVIDHAEQYFAATTAPNGRQIPLELTHCRVTVKSDSVVIVRNAVQDDRFASPFVDVTQMRFYAGVPLKNGDGRTIGTFCVASALPTAFGRVTEDHLLQYANQAQAELQRLAGDSLSRQEVLESGTEPAEAP